MTEAEWLACDDSRPMLAYLDGEVSARKRSLAECAFLRRFWNVLPDERTRKAIEAAEQSADGALSSEDLQRARAAARQAFHAAEWEEQKKGAVFGAFLSGYLLAAQIAGRAFPVLRYMLGTRTMVGLECLASAAKPIWYAPACPEAFGGRAASARAPGSRPLPLLRWEDQAFREACHAAVVAGRSAQADILRDLFGNPFRPVSVDPAWRAWEGGTIPRLARVLYDARRFEDLPVLADALEDAGCSDEALLSHCRTPGPHVRGCWALDLLLGKR
jgi:hypothetical protein